MSQRITHPQSIAPEPIELAAIQRSLYRVLPSQEARAERLGNWRFFADQDAVAINAFPRDAVKPLRDVQAFDSHYCACAGFGFQPHASVAEAVLRKLVSMASH